LLIAVVLFSQGLHMVGEQAPGPLHNTRDYSIHQSFPNYFLDGPSS